MRGHKTIVTPELEEKVIRCYVERGMSLSTMANLGICGVRDATKILNEHGVMKKPETIRFGAKIPWDSPPH